MRITLNGAARETEAATLDDLLGDLLSEPPGALPVGSAVALNGEVVPRAQMAARTLADGDQVEVVTAVAGG